MSKTIQILLGVIAFLVVILILVPMLPATYFIKQIVTVGVVIAAIIWVLNLGGIVLP